MTFSWRSSCASRRSPSTCSALPSSPSTGAASSTTPASSAGSGFFSNNTRRPIFVPTTNAFALSTATMRHAEWWALDCRHGCALFESHTTGLLLVWDLMTGGKRYLPLPPAWKGVCQGAVLCAAGHTDHGDCRSCPFLLVYVSSRTDGTTSACICSSQTGIWTEVSSIPAQASSSVDGKRMALIGSTLYGLLDDCNIFEFDLDNHSLGLTKRIPDYVLRSYRWEIIIMPTEDGLLGLAGVEGFNLHLWSMVKSICGAVTWTCQRVIDLKKFLAPEVVASVVAVEPIGFAEDAGVIFIYMHPSDPSQVHSYRGVKGRDLLQHFSLRKFLLSRYYRSWWR